MQPLCLYNEIDPYAAAWLRNLIADGLIAPGIVNETSIVELQPSDVAGFTQVHFFAGIGGWSLAARLAGWPDTRPLWTGSCPCQPFSVAGKGAGQEDVRHLWPEFHRLIAACRPDVVMGEQVAAAVGKSWLDGVCSDLESIGYACGAAVVPACAVDAPHRRDRLWFVANDGAGRRAGPLGWQGEQPGRAETVGASDPDGMANAHEQGLERRITLRECGDERSLGSHGVAAGVGTLVDDPSDRRSEGRTESEFRGWRDTAAGAGFWNPSELAIGADGKARRVKPGVRLLVNGVSGRVAIRRPGEQSDAAAQEHWYNRIGALRAFGNAIVPQVAAEIIGAYLDCAPTLPGPAAPLTVGLPG